MISQYELNKFIGTENYYVHGFFGIKNIHGKLKKLVLTDGTKYLRDVKENENQCYWIFDEIVYALNSKVVKKINQYDIHFWHLITDIDNNNSCLYCFRDFNSTKTLDQNYSRYGLYKKNIDNDFFYQTTKIEHLVLYCQENEQFFVVFLPSEY